MAESPSRPPPEPARPAGGTPAEAAGASSPGGELPGHTPLRRAIGTRLLFLFVLGDMLGGGIYALVGEVGGEVGGAI